MTELRSLRLALAASALALAAGCAGKGTAVQSMGPAYADWPRIESAVPRSDAIEARAAQILQGMTLEQKIGQMTQPDIRWATPEDVRHYYIGSVLNGGGAWPRMDKAASIAEWAALADSYHDAALHTDMAVKVPLIWGVDAVHGHNNVRGATLFPHNIGLGAAHDVLMMRDIGRATARAVRATGITWAFAPTLAVVQDPRWGRTYESYSSDPELVLEYGAAMVDGLQGDLSGDAAVVASAKHFLGDGGTLHGDDQGITQATPSELINIHGAGYFGAIGAGVQTVMVSYSSWTDTATGEAHGKMHGNPDLVTSALKDKMGFDGFVVSDWNGVEQVPGCTKAHCPQAINAGIDMVMVPEDWKAFIANTVADVRSGAIPMARIDDAVTRILRVKLRTGLFDREPSASALNGDASALTDAALARHAVRESLVLLKNDRAALPLAPGKPLLVVGKAADSMAMQSGGWSVTWQGTETVNADYPAGETLLAALRKAVGAGQVVYSADGKGVDVSRFAAVVAVLGEQPYAEGAGDVDWPAPLAHSVQHPEDSAVLAAVSGKGVPVVSVLYSGRPTYANDLINASDAFVAAWLPGSEAGGIADLLVRPRAGRMTYDFRGTLPFAWPADPCVTRAGPAQPVTFPREYGLRYKAAKPLGALPLARIPERCD